MSSADPPPSATTTSGRDRSSSRTSSATCSQRGLARTASNQVTAASPSRPSADEVATARRLPTSSTRSGRHQDSTSGSRSIEPGPATRRGRPGSTGAGMDRLFSSCFRQGQCRPTEPRRSPSGFPDTGGRVGRCDAGRGGLMLPAVVDCLACPYCRLPLSEVDGTVRCARGHSFDLARQGYVTLLPAGARGPAGDDAAMVAARAGFLAAGHYAPLTAALVAAAGRVGRAGARRRRRHRGAPGRGARRRPGRGRHRAGRLPVRGPPRRPGAPAGRRGRRRRLVRAAGAHRRGRPGAGRVLAPERPGDRAGAAPGRAAGRGDAGAGPPGRAGRRARRAAGRRDQGQPAGGGAGAAPGPGRPGRSTGGSWRCPGPTRPARSRWARRRGTWPTWTRGWPALPEPVRATASIVVSRYRRP